MIPIANRLAARARPEGMAIGRQRWSDLLFLHWQIEPETIQATLPAGLTVDTHDNAAYIGIVPFLMERVRPRFLPPLPWLSWFFELNVRTYVRDAHGRPGVFFYSLDCNQPIAVWVARKAFHLPYYYARMTVERNDRHILFTSQRTSSSTLQARYSWGAEGPAREALPGSLEFFLVERYFLFTANANGRLHSGRVHHRPYQFKDARVLAYSTEPARLAGFPLPGDPVSSLSAEMVDVSIYPLQEIRPVLDIYSNSLSK